MKKISFLGDMLPIEVVEGIDYLVARSRRKPLPRQLFLLICLNLVIIPAVQAATGGEISRGQAFWLTALGLVTLTLSVYLFVVIFQPERF
ncbi:potassium-transporting ATPase subunit F [Trichocoleus sp. FACHB-90]|uniref:potassium-transporting ATPase subunit F n=2 Tax=Cyanophyceae TaxID=3028117 RepID=UPI001689D174|nr:potassium-transporting ATPase subunit F [Trichocoleus sp. FACHB-90]MBD1925266.1 potassium-transporting ATPase subunit F [Trichocoleus sp. FACHB-90]